MEVQDFKFWNRLSDQVSKMLVMAIRVVEFSRGGTKLERFLHKNQHTQSNY